MTLLVFSAQCLCNCHNFLPKVHHSCVFLSSLLSVLFQSCFCSSSSERLRFKCVSQQLMCASVSCVVRPQPPTQNMPMGPGGMNQSGPPPQPPHGHNMPSEGMVSGGPPAPHMQNQMNGQMPGKWPPHTDTPAPQLSPPPSPFSPSFPLVPVSLGLPSNTTDREVGRSAEGWCHPFTTSGGAGLVLLVWLWLSPPHGFLSEWAALCFLFA